MADDVELLAAWRAGDPRSGQALFSRYFDQVSRFFLNKVPHDHEDLIQETFAACVSGRDRIRDGKSFRSYLFSTAYNLLKKYYSRRAKLPLASLESHAVEHLAPGPSTLLRADEEASVLFEALRRIPLELQVVLEMRYWEGMSSSEIGDTLGIPPGTVRTRIARGRKEVATVLEQRGIRTAELTELDGWAQRVRELMEPENS